jgi:hypothetical protein
MYKSSAFQQASSEYSYLSFTCKDRGIPYIVKPVVRGHLWNKEKVALQDRWSLKRGSIHMKFSMTDDILIQVTALKEVTTWAGLTVLIWWPLMYNFW